MRSFKNFKILILFFFVILSFSPRAKTQGLARVQENFVKISDHLYVLKGAGCNIAGLVDQEGVLIIDSGARNQSAKTISTLKEISGGPVRVLINTHYHFDHVGGNEVFVKEGAMIVAHKNTRERMEQEWRTPEILGIKYPTIPPYPDIFLPKIIFYDSLTIHFNDETVQAIHIPDAHSDSDIIVYFHESNIIHTGDLYLSNGFPIIDIYHGGSVSGYIVAVDRIIQFCNENTKIIPGHGPLSNRDELIAYRDMLAKVRDRIKMLMKEGQTLEEIVAADPISELFHGEKSWLTPNLFIACVYQEFSNIDTSLIP